MPVNVPIDVTQMHQYQLVSNSESPDPVPVKRSDGTVVNVPLATLVGPPAVILLASPDVTNAVGGANANNPGYLGGIRGYPVLGGTTGHQWMISPLITAGVAAAFEAIPGTAPTGWQNLAARQTFVDLGLTLINPPYNIAPATVVGAWKQLFTAAHDEIGTRVAQGYIVPGINQLARDEPAAPAEVIGEASPPITAPSGDDTPPPAPEE